MQKYINQMQFNSFEELEKKIQENSNSGYESAITGNNGKAVKYGSLVSDDCELPDKVKNCRLQIWNNDYIDTWLTDNNYKTI